MKTTSTHTKVFAVLLFCMLVLFFAPTPASAQTDYTLLEEIPNFFENKDNIDLTFYLQNLFRLGVAVATALAVIMITLGGIKYMTSEVVSDKASGKKYITDAVIGLILALSVFIILQAINPKLVQFDLVNTLNKLTGRIPVPAGPTPQTPPPDMCTMCGFFDEKKITLAGRPTCEAATCQAHVSLINALYNLNARIEPDMYITEAWPPTLQHKNVCHEQGTCVDGNPVGQLGVSQYAAGKIGEIVSAASAVGITACYEVASPVDKGRLVDFGAPASNITVIPGITPHFSLYGYKTSC